MTGGLGVDDSLRLLLNPSVLLELTPEKRDATAAMAGGGATINLTFLLPSRERDEAPGTPLDDP